MSLEETPNIVETVEEFLGIRKSGAEFGNDNHQPAQNRFQILPETEHLLNAFLRLFVCELSDIWGETAPVWDYDCDGGYEVRKRDWDRIWEKAKEREAYRKDWYRERVFFGADFP